MVQKLDLSEAADETSLSDACSGGGMSDIPLEVLKGDRCIVSVGD